MGIHVAIFLKVNSWLVFWSDDNQMTISNWNVGMSEDDAAESCAFINGTDGLWYLADCKDRMNYVCKVSPGIVPGGLRITRTTRQGQC